LPGLDGRRLWFVGIGGAGMSALAVVARAWGAEVAGWDRYDTPYLEPLRDVEVVISPDPVAGSSGWETVVSTAYADRVEGTSRGRLLAEIVGLRPSIVVAGAHGKTTTAAMIAYALDGLGLDPSFLVGGPIPQLGGNARAGEGWLVAEGDESDRSLELLRPEIGVLTNVDLDHHTTFSSRAEVAELFERWLSSCGSAVRGDDLESVPFELAVPGEHNRRNAATALAALGLAGIDVEAATAVLATFRGAGRRFERRGDAAGVSLVDDYAHHPAEIAATLEAAREAFPDGRALVLFQPHLYSRTRYLADELAAALGSADFACVTEIYGAREQPVEGISGKLVVDALAAARPGSGVGWAPGLEDAAVLVARRARAGDLVLTMGAGDVDRAAPMILDWLSERRAA
jgi:UDP-N-acetylmuramate--alanine ligase